MKSAALMAVPAAVVTLILPFVAPAGTNALICVDEFTTNAAVVLLKFTAVAPVKFKPVIVTWVLAAPKVGVKEVMTGPTVKSFALKAVPPPVITLILPVVAPDGTVARSWLLESNVNVVAAVPLN